MQSDNAVEPYPRLERLDNRALRYHPCAQSVSEGGDAVFSTTIQSPYSLLKISRFVQSRRTLLLREHLEARADDTLADHLGFGRIAASETEAPNMFANLVWSGMSVVQSDDATEPHDHLVVAEPEALCRGTWARVTIDRFRHLALQTF